MRRESKVRRELSKRQRLTLKQLERFAKSESLEDAFLMVNRGIDAHGRFVHYTKLSRVAQILESGRWWLTRADSDSLNDVQEARKYGNFELLGRMYQVSFSYGSAENTAMWGLYCPGDPFGVMISIDGKAMREWFAEIRDKKCDARLEYPETKARPGKHVNISKAEIDCSDARDVIYAATKFADTSYREKDRSDILCWYGATTEKIEGLEQEIKGDKFTGWIKDYEWRQENESRIAVRVKGIAGKLPNHLSIKIPDSVLKSMRFTLSPWLKDEYYDETHNVVRALTMKHHPDKIPENLVSRSVITGALESWRNRYQGSVKNLKSVKKNH